MDDGSISVFEKMDALQNATILEVQIHIDDLKDKLEEVKFTLKISGLYLKKIILWILIINLIPIVYHKNYLLSINNDKE